MTRIQAASDYGWRSFRLRIGPAELVFVPEIGGRLMGIRVAEEEILFVNPDICGVTPDTAKLRSLPTRAPQIPFPLWGGEKTWIAPQSGWADGAPSPQLDSGPYEVALEQDGACITMTSPVCPRSGLQIERSIVLGGGAGWITRHTIRNHGTRPVFAGPWTVMMINRDALFYIPSAGAPFSVMSGQPEPLIGSLGTLTCLRCDDGSRFKTGHQLAEGWLAAFRPSSSGGGTMIAQFCTIPPGSGGWAHGHPAEIYNSDAYPYCEMEIHGTAADLAPGAQLQWELRTVVCSMQSLPVSEADVRDAICRANGGHPSR